MLGMSEGVNVESILMTTMTGRKEMEEGKRRETEICQEDWALERKGTGLTTE